jgi:ribA/ribD-fused uncharacterized protein
MEIKYKGKWVYNWFSNFTEEPITIDNITYPSVENYYQSQKTVDLGHRKIFETCTPSQSKFYGRKVNLRPDWENVKVDIMKKALKIKFAKGTDNYNKLLQEKEDIVEWNN